MRYNNTSYFLIVITKEVLPVCNFGGFMIWLHLIRLFFLLLLRVRVLNTTFNNISVISWQLVLLVEETGVPGENL